MGKGTDDEVKPDRAHETGASGASDRASDTGVGGASDRADDLDKDPRADERSRALATQEASRGAKPAASQGQAAPVMASLHGLTRTTTAPSGTVVAEAQIDSSFVPLEFLPADPPPQVRAALLVDGDRLIVDVTVAADHWTTSLSATEAAEALVGRDAMKQLGSAVDFVHKLATRRATGRMFRIPLWGTAPNDSFVVLDFVKIVRSIGRGTLTGFRPVEAQILLNDTDGKNVGGVKLFGGEAVPAASAIPGKPIGDWFPLPDIPELHAALGQEPTEGKPELWGGAFYSDGVLRVAVKPSKDAKTGIVAHLDIQVLVDKLAAFGEKVAAWIKKLLEKIQAGAINLFKSLSLGKLRLELPEFEGIYFDFDFKLTLPKLFKGGGGGFGFDLSGLMPSGFNFDFKFGLSLGAMPKVSFPWLRAPKLGSFDVPWDRIKGLLPDLNLPSLQMPSVPSFNFGFHRIGGLKFGFGTDLSLAWPELGDLSLGFTLDLDKILNAIAGAGKWLLNKLRAAGDFLNRWIHFGSDGVLRIYDRDRPDGPMLGFHLMRLLDGAQAEDMVPTEIRWTEKEAGIALELGEKHEAGEEQKGDKGKGAPEKPGGILLTKKTSIDPPDSLATAMALADGAKVDAELHAEGDHIVVWAEAASSVYDKGQALRTSLNVRMLATRVIKNWPAGRGKAPGTSHFELDKDPAHSANGARINFQVPTAVGVQGGNGYALWKIEHLLRAKDWTDLAPDELNLPLGKLGGAQIGTLDYSVVGEPLGQRFEFQSAAIAKKLLHDADTTVYGALHKKDDNIGVSVTKDANGNEGALAHVNLTYLLEQLKKLGDVGRRALEYIAELKLPGWKSGGGKSDVFARIAEIAKAIGGALSDLVNGILKLDLGNGRFIQWNIKAQLPRLGIDLDLGDLIPEFNLSMPGMPDFSFAFMPSGSFGNPLEGLSFKLPDLGLRDLLGKLPNVKLPKDLNVNLSWISDLLGVSVELGDLFGTGNLSFGFRLPIQNMLAKLGKLFGNVGGKAKDLAKHLHLGSDGVLRIFDPADPKGARVGFDLKKLFDGVDPEDLVPVEAHAEVEAGTGADKKTLATVSYGDAYVSDKDEKDAKLPDKDNKGGGKHTGAVLVPRPKGNAIDHATFTAPEWLQSHLGAPKNARVHASLYVTGKPDEMVATLFAVVDNSDRGVEVKINIAALSSAANVPSNDGKGITFDKQASMGRGMLVLAVKTEKVSGHAGWKIASLLNTPSLSDLLPNELVLERKEGKLTVGSEIDVSHLQRRGEFEFPNWEYVRQRIGANKKVAVYTNDFKKAEPKIALVDASDQDGKSKGLEIELDQKFVAVLNTKLKLLSKQVKGTVGSVLGRSPDAQKQGLENLEIYPTTSGIMVERGQRGDEFHMYAKWGWQDLGALMEGDVTVENLMPDDFRVATRALAVEVKDLETQKDQQLPQSAKLVSQLHPLLQKPLTTFGILPSQWVDLGLNRPETKVVDEENQLIRIHGAIYDANAALTITGGKTLDLDVSVQALIAQVMPQRQRAWSKKKPKDPNKKFHVTGGIDIHKDSAGQADGIDLHAGVQRKNAQGEETEFEVRAGWTFDQILNMLMNLDQLVKDDGRPNLAGAAGLMAPDRIDGFFETDDFKVAFEGNKGTKSSMSTSVDDIPGLGPLLGMIVDPATLAATKLHLNLPSRDAFTKSFDEATAKIKHGEVDYKLPIGNCAVEMPVSKANAAAPDPEPKLHKVTLSVSPLKFKALLQLIPGIGQYIKIADLVIGVLKDPKGALEGAMYTPEALYMVFENSGEIWGAIKDKGWKGVAMAMFVNGDMTTKQGVMAGRVYKKMKAAGWTKKGDKIPDVAGMDVKYLEWLAAQDGDKLVAMSKLSDEMDAMGLGGALDQEKPQIPTGGLPDVETINTRIEQIKAGYEAFAKVQQDSPNDQGAIDKAAADLRKRVEKAIQAGAKPSGGVDMSDKAKSKDAPTNTGDREYSDINDLPPIDPDRAKTARDIFDDGEKKEGDAGKDVVVVSIEDAQYLVRKYSGLSTDQLADMLADGHTKVTTSDGRQREMPMHEEERSYVRTLFKRRLEAEGVALKTKPGSGPTNDVDVVHAYRTAKARAERAEERGKGSSNDASGQEQSGGAGESDTMSYEDGEGSGGTLDDVFGDGKEAEEGGGGGDGGGDGAEHEEDGTGKSPTGGDKDTGGDADAGGGGEVAPEQEQDRVFKAPGFKHMRELTKWDAAKGELVIDPKMKATYIKNLAGDRAYLQDIELEQKAVEADETMVSVTLVLVAQVLVDADKGTWEERRDRTEFYYRPSVDKFDQEGGSDFLSMFKKVVSLSADGKQAVIGNGGKYKDAQYEFTVVGADQPKTYSKGVTVHIDVRFDKLPKQMKIKNDQGTWMTPAIGATVGLLMPFETPG